jgi:Tfp pilus assembly protein PilF/4-amino-4-deoxy-L-arabinose transferase-like glycosyltransferase
MAKTAKQPAPSEREITGTDSTRKREMKAAVLVLVAAAIIRLAYFLQYKALVPYFATPVLDAMYYDAWAGRVVMGQGYGPMPFYMSPMYPYILAAVYFVVGHSYTVVYVLQMILGLVNLLLTYALGRRLFGHKAGLIAMVLMTVYAPLVYLETKLLTETLAIALNLTFLLLLMRAMKRPGLTGFLVAGIVMGLSAVCRPSALVSVALIVAWMLLSGLKSPRRISFRYTAIMMLGVMLAILPVTARNYFVGHDLVLISSNGGLVFAQANNPGANGVSTAIGGFSGSIMTQQQEEMAAARQALGHPVKPSESSSFWLGKSLEFIRQKPGVFAKLLGMKVLWSIHNREADCSYNVYIEKSLVPVLRFLALPFAMLAGLGLFGFITGRRTGVHRDIDLLAIYAASVFVGLIIFAVTSRYRVPSIPAFCIFAGYGLVRVWDAFAGRRTRELIFAVSGIAAFALISLVPYPTPYIPASGLANLGASYMEIGRMDEAMQLTKKALAMEPDQESIHQQMAIVLMQARKIDDAVREFKRAVQIAPENPELRNDLGFALQRKGNALGAEAEFRAAISLKPDYVEAHLGLANSLLKQGRHAEAGQERKTANSLGPDLALQRLNQGSVFQAHGDPDEAIRLYEDAIRLKSDYADAYVSLGLTYKDKQNLPEAVRCYREAARIDPGLTRAHNNLAIALYYQRNYAGAWKEVHASRKHGGAPHPGFLRALADKMPDPGR